MSENYWRKSESRKLFEAYVALELAKDVARGYDDERPASQILEPVVVILDITTKLLEEVLQSVLPEESEPFNRDAASSSTTELVM